MKKVYAELEYQASAPLETPPGGESMMVGGDILPDGVEWAYPSLAQRELVCRLRDEGLGVKSVAYHTDGVTVSVQTLYGRVSSVMLVCPRVAYTLYRDRYEVTRQFQGDPLLGLLIGKLDLSEMARLAWWPRYLERGLRGRMIGVDGPTTGWFWA